MREPRWGGGAVCGASSLWACRLRRLSAPEPRVRFNHPQGSQVVKATVCKTVYRRFESRPWDHFVASKSAFFSADFLVRRHRDSHRDSNPCGRMRTIVDRAYLGPLLPRGGDGVGGHALSSMPEAASDARYLFQGGRRSTVAATYGQNRDENSHDSNPGPDDRSAVDAVTSK